MTCYARHGAPQAKFRGPDTSKVPISLNFEVKPCVLVIPWSPTLPCIHTSEATSWVRYLHCRLPDRYVRYTLSCTRSVAILVGPPGPGPVFLFLFSPARPLALELQAPHSPRSQFRSAWAAIVLPMRHSRPGPTQRVRVNMSRTCHQNVTTCHKMSQHVTQHVTNMSQTCHNMSTKCHQNVNMSQNVTKCHRMSPACHLGLLA